MQSSGRQTKPIVIFYNESLASFLIYSRFIKSHPELICCLVKFPIIKNLKAGLIKKILSTSLEYIAFNFFITSFYSFFARLFKNRLEDLAKKQNITTIKSLEINEDLIKNLQSKNPSWLLNNSYFILKKGLLDIFPLGSVNYHAAPLPKYRGAANSFWMLANKEKECLATLHYITEKLDAGNIIAVSDKIHIQPRMTVFDLWFDLRLGAFDCFDKIINYFKNQNLIPSYPQEKISDQKINSLPPKKIIKDIVFNGHKIISLKNIITIIKVAKTPLN